MKEAFWLGLGIAGMYAVGFACIGIPLFMALIDHSKWWAAAIPLGLLVFVPSCIGFMNFCYSKYASR